MVAVDVLDNQRTRWTVDTWMARIWTTEIIDDQRIISAHHDNPRTT
jgi:hypothetical protein